MDIECNPGSGGDFNAWETNFVRNVSDNTAALGLLPGDVTPLANAQTAWTPAYSGHVIAQAAAEAARENKDNTRRAFEGLVRPLVNRLQTSPTVTDEQRQAVGITVRDTHHTRVGPPPVDPSEYAFIALDTRTPYTLDFPAADGGKTAYCPLRWVNTKGEKGPWSTTYSGMIMA